MKFTTVTLIAVTTALSQDVVYGAKKISRSGSVRGGASKEEAKAAGEEESNFWNKRILEEMSLTPGPTPGATPEPTPGATPEPTPAPTTKPATPAPTPDADCGLELQIICQTAGDNPIPCEEIPTPTDPQCAVGEKLDALELSWINQDCSASNNGQSDFQCEDFDVPVGDEIELTCYNRDDPSEIVCQCVTISKATVTGPQKALPEYTTCEIRNSETKELAQKITFASDGSVDLRLGDTYGGIKVDGCSDENDTFTNMNCCYEVDYLYILQNTGPDFTVVDYDRYWVERGSSRDLIPLIPPEKLFVPTDTFLPTLQEPAIIDVCKDACYTTTLNATTVDVDCEDSTDRADCFVGIPTRPPTAPSPTTPTAPTPTAPTPTAPTPTAPTPTAPTGPSPTTPATPSPTASPVDDPTDEPTPDPTAAPVEDPTDAPTPEPTAAPVPDPTDAPTAAPVAPTPAPQATSRVKEVILTVALEGGAEFDDPDSYQSKSLAFVEGDSNSESYTDEQIIQRYALGCYYYATFGVENSVTAGELPPGSTVPGWTKSNGWVTEDDECTWLGITCANGKVSEIVMAENRMTGVLPAEISLMGSSLEAMDLFGNAFLQAGIGENGNAWLGELTNMKRFFHAFCKFESNVGIPSEIGQMTLLEEYDCAFNVYKGSLQGSTFSSLNNLVFLDISGGLYQSGLPDELLSLDIEDFFVTDAFLEDDVSYLTSMQSLFQHTADSNQNLVGQLPEGSAISSSLELLSFSFCGLTGTIPGSLGQLTNMQRMFLNSNQIGGEVPAELGQMSVLQELELQDNNLGGTMPQEICNNVVTSPLSPGLLEVLIADCAEVSCDCCTECA